MRQIEKGGRQREQHHIAHELEQPFERKRGHDLGAGDVRAARDKHDPCGFAAIRHEHVVQSGAGERGAERQRKRRRTDRPEKHPPADGLHHNGEDVHQCGRQQHGARRGANGRPDVVPIHLRREDDEHHQDEQRKPEADGVRHLLVHARPVQLGSVTNPKPRARSPSMMRGNASAVCVRSPLAS